MEMSKKDQNETDHKVIDLKTGSSRAGDGKSSKLGGFEPNEELLQATARVKKQRDVIMERIDKMQQAKPKVSSSVFEKVSRDYQLQLQTISELLDEKKELLKKEIKDLYVRREKLSVEVNRHKEILEEADFRHYLGEFSQSQFQEVENFETKEINKLESDLSYINQFIRSHEELFDPSDLRNTPQQKPQYTKTEVTKTAASAPAVETTAVQEAPQAKSDQDISFSDYEDLFLDDSDSETNAQIESSQQNVQELLQDSSAAEDAEIPEPDFDAEKTSSHLDIKADDSNYYSNDQVNESSFEISHTSKEQAQAIVAEAQDDSFSSEDSISEILDSIHLEEGSETPPEKEDSNIPSSGVMNQNTSAQGAEFQLRLIDGNHEEQIFALKENTSIGRSPSNDIALKAPKVSRQHAAINMYNGQFILIDLKSSNGVFVNGAKIDECVLSPGDEISVGGYKFKLEKTS